MTEPRRTRHDPRKAATQLLIIEEAERLFAQHGLEGVSLRQIGAGAGSANTSVVRYHFGSKEGLLQAIFERRLGELEVARAKALAGLKAAAREGEVRGLIDALCRPVAEQVDRNGRHSYAAFLVGLQRFGQLELRNLQGPPTPVADEILARLRSVLPVLPAKLAERRLRIVPMMVFEGLANAAPAADEAAARTMAAELDDLLAMAACALVAPPGAAAQA